MVCSKNLDGKLQRSVIWIVICVTVGYSWVLWIFSIHFSCQGSSWSWRVRACADECFKELLRDLGPKLQSLKTGNFCSSLHGALAGLGSWCTPTLAGSVGEVRNSHFVSSVCPCLFEGQSALSLAVSASVASLSHWPQYLDMLEILVLCFLSLSVSALIQYDYCRFIDSHFFRSQSWISPSVGRAWEPRWLLPGETIVADEAVTNDIFCWCMLLLSCQCVHRCFFTVSYCFSPCCDFLMLWNLSAFDRSLMQILYSYWCMDPVWQWS